MSRQIFKAAWFGMILACAANSWAAEAANWADSLFAEHSIDFGPVPRGAKVRHKFTITNRLKETVHILDVRASCGCTTGQASASSVEPGKTAYVEAQMDTRNFVGPKATTLTVTLMTSSGHQGEAKFGVQSNILADIVLNPGSIDFGTVPKGKTPKITITIERAGAPSWRAERMVSTSKVLDAKLVETYRSGAGVGYSLSVSLKPNASAGAIRDEIRIVTNDPESPNVPVLVTGVVQGTLTASPAMLALGNVPIDRPTQGRFVVRAAKPFTIASIEGTGDGFQLDPAENVKKTMHVLTLTYRADQSSIRGDLRRTFRVRTDLPDEAPLELNATLHVAP